MQEERFRENVDLIREVFSYSHQFKDKLFVIKIDNLIINQPGFPVLVKDLAALKRTGINIILVSGANEKIDEVLEIYNMKDVYDLMRVSYNSQYLHRRSAPFTNQRIELINLFDQPGPRGSALCGSNVYVGLLLARQVLCFSKRKTVENHRLSRYKADVVRKALYG